MTGAGERMRVLHIAECFAAGVRTAMLEYIASTPMIEHIVVAADRGEPMPESCDSYRVIGMAHGHVARIHQVRTLCREFHPALIHAHSSFAGVYARIGCSDVPVVYTPHCFGFERGDLPVTARRILWLAERSLVGRTAVVAACSLREARLARKLGAPSVCIPNVGRFGHDIVRAAAGESRDGISEVAFMGRITPQKDPGFALEAVRRIAALREGRVLFEWIGDGPAADRARLEDAGVRVTGWLSAEEVAAELSRCAVYVHTAAWEGFPMAVLEASQLGLPIVARAIPALEGMPEEFLADDPETVAAIAARAMGAPRTRGDCAARWDEALSGNTRGNQRDALIAAYSRAIGRAIQER